MGANASTENGSGSGTTGSGQRPPGVPLDHYEVLGISTESTSDEIKKAFRKAALREHPDKNPNDIQGSTKRFAIIQAAYEVLSDEQERAWYDDHREQILNGGQAGEGPQDLAAEASYFDSLRKGGGTNIPKPRSAHNRGVTTLQLMKFFTTSSWSSFDESLTGFYTTFRTLFALIASEEIALQTRYTYPTFGTQHSDYEGVVKRFYTAWLDFATEKEFGWLDQYKVEERMERRMKRAIEQENKRERQVGRREYNETVRNLVLYVRRRDPRWQTGQSTLCPEAQRAAELAKIRADLLLAAKERALENEQLAAQYQAQEWQKGNEEVFKQWEERSEEEGASEEGDYEDEQWCVACGKGFMSGGAWENHERSRKHQKNVERLIKEMQEEDEALGLGRTDEPGQDDEGGEEEVEDEEDKDEEEDSPPIASTSRSPSPTSSLAEDVAAFNLASTNDPEADEGIPLPTKGKKNKRRKAATAIPLEDVVLDEPDLDTLGIAKKSKKGKKGQSGLSTLLQLDVSPDLEEDHAIVEDQVEEVLPPSGGKKSRRAKGKGKEAKGSGMSTPAEGGGGANTPIDLRGDQDDLDLAKAEEAEMSKKDKRRLKEAAKKAGTGTGTKNEEVSWARKGLGFMNLITRVGMADVGFARSKQRCNVCSEVFPSRTKLFDHIKATGHALVEGPATTGKAGSKKKNKR